MQGTMHVNKLTHTSRVFVECFDLTALASLQWRDVAIYSDDETIFSLWVIYSNMTTILLRVMPTWVYNPKLAFVRHNV